jgi:hypothetical protein
MSHQLCNSADIHSCHHQPRGESVPVAVPGEVQVMLSVAMKTSVLALVIAVSVVVSAQSVNDETAKHAAQTIARLHDSMLDPASFVLDAAYVTKPNKHGAVSYCYEFRSHNTMGGDTAIRQVAVLWHRLIPCSPPAMRLRIYTS